MQLTSKMPSPSSCVARIFTNLAKGITIEICWVPLNCLANSCRNGVLSCFSSNHNDMQTGDLSKRVSVETVILRARLSLL